MASGGPATGRLFSACNSDVEVGNGLKPFPTILDLGLLAVRSSGMVTMINLAILTVFRYIRQNFTMRIGCFPARLFSLVKGRTLFAYILRTSVDNPTRVFAFPEVSHPLSLLTGHLLMTGNNYTMVKVTDRSQIH